MSKKTLYATIGGAVLLFLIGFGLGGYFFSDHHKPTKIYRCFDCKDKGSEYSCKRCKEYTLDLEKIQAFHAMQKPTARNHMAPPPAPRDGCPCMRNKKQPPRHVYHEMRNVDDSKYQGTRPDRAPRPQNIQGPQIPQPQAPHSEPRINPESDRPMPANHPEQGINPDQPHN